MDLVPQPIKIEEVDVDNYVSAEDKITKWHLKVQQQFKSSFGIECKTSLENLMKWYLKSLFEEIFYMELSNRFILLMQKHIHHFHSYFKNLNLVFTEDYLDYMEDILAFYLDCEGKVYGKDKINQKRNKKRLRKKLLTILKLYLLNREERIHHVLIKMRLNLSSNEAKEFLDNVYRVVFSQRPRNKSDIAFCRAFILYQKWKRIQDSSMWNTLDKMLHETYSRSPGSINVNEVWKEISGNNSLIELIAQIGENDKAISEMYFNYLKSQNVQENLNALSVSTMNLEDETLTGSDVVKGSATKPNDFQSIINATQNIETVDEDSVIKTETGIDSDDDCVFVSESLCVDNNQILVEILDDKDDDIAEITYLRLTKDSTSMAILNSKRKKGNELSFLDSIDITENELEAEINDDTTAPVSNLQNSDNDSVRSREILSCKFTRKKETLEQQIVCGSPKNLNLTYVESFKPDLASTPKCTEVRSAGSYVSPTLTGTYLELRIETPDDQETMAQDTEPIELNHAEVEYDNHPSNGPINSVHMDVTYPLSPYSLTLSPNSSSLTFDQQDVETSTKLENISKIVDSSKDLGCRESRKSLEEPIEGIEITKNFMPKATNSTAFHINNSRSGRLNSPMNLKDPVNIRSDKNKKPATSPKLLRSARKMESPSVSAKNVKSTNHLKSCLESNIKTVDSLDSPKSLERPKSSKPVTIIESTEILEYNREDSIQNRQSPDAKSSETVQPEQSRVKSPVVLNDTRQNVSLQEIKSPKNRDNQQCNGNVHMDVSPTLSPNSSTLTFDHQDVETGTKFENISKIKDSSKDLRCPENRKSEEKPIEDIEIKKNVTPEATNSTAGHVNYSRHERLNSPMNLEDPINIRFDKKKTATSPRHLRSSRKMESPSMSVKNVQSTNNLKSVVNSNIIETLENVYNLNLDSHKSLERPKSSNLQSPHAKSSDTVKPAQSRVKFPVVLNDAKQNVEKKLMVAVPRTNIYRSGSDKTGAIKQVLDLRTSSSQDGSEIKNNAVTPSPEKKMDVIFTQKVPRLDNDVHSRYRELIGGHGLDDCLTGDIEKINPKSVSTIVDFDFFEGTPCQPPKNHDGSLSPQDTPTTANSPLNLRSPVYERMDDFKLFYLDNYQMQEAIKKNSITKDNKIEGKVEINDKNRNVLVASPKHRPVKRRKLVFSKEYIIKNCTKNDIIENVSPKPHIGSDKHILGILKEHVEYQRIPLECMNLKSLTYYKVRPNDPCLQSKPQVIVEKLSESEIKGWLNISKKTRKNDKNSTMTLIRVNYDKSIPWINEDDTMLYEEPEDMAWRANNNQNLDVPEEGTVQQLSDEYIHIPDICRNLCCSFLSNMFDNLNLSSSPKNFPSSINRKPNALLTPYNLKTSDNFGKREAYEKPTSPLSNTQDFDDVKLCNNCVDLNIVNEIVKNFDNNCHDSLNLNSFDFINQPAIIPEVEEFEKTLKLEEVTKISTIPSDLHNLNLRKFSPSPVMNFSSHSNSPAHTFFSDCFNCCTEKIMLDCCRVNDKIVPSRDNTDCTIINDRISPFNEIISDDVKLMLDDKLDSDCSNIDKITSFRDPEDLVAVREDIQDPTDERIEPIKEPEVPSVQDSPEPAKKNPEEVTETRLPLKKRKHSVAARDETDDDDFIGPELIEEIIKRARAEKNEKEDISYPAKRAISIAEVQEKLVDSRPRTFKTPAQKKEMPEMSPPNSHHSGLAPPPPNIVTEQYNNHTYNNPTINYHMNNVPYPFFPCTSLTYFPPILLPMNSTATFDVNMMNQQQPLNNPKMQPAQDPPGRVKKEKRSKRRRKD